MAELTRIIISPQDLLDAARTIRLGRIHKCNWLEGWISPSTFLNWARRGLAEGDPYGLNIAISYAKRSACCRIDLLVQYYHLAPFFRANYPAKIAALEQVGIDIPGVVHKLVIDPRNELEHNYQHANQDTSRQAVDIADLFLRATQDEEDRSSIVALNWNIMGSYMMSAEGGAIEFREFGHEPMLFIDVFESPRSLKIIDPDDGEIRFTELGSFSGEQCIELARLLRSNYTEPSFSSSGFGQNYYREMKRQGGF